MLLATLLGFVFGWLGSIPVAGPISALVVTRGIQGRQRAGLAIAIGGGVGEAAYAFLAFWGFANYLANFPIIVPVSRAAAAIILTALGIAFARGGKKEVISELPPRDSILGSFVLGVGLCLLNPTLIATWTAVITTLYSSQLIDFSSGQALPFAVGSCAGIAGWYAVLLWLIRRHKERFTLGMLARGVRWIGFSLLVLAVWFAFRFVQYLVES